MSFRRILLLMLLNIVTTLSVQADEVETWLASYEAPQSLALKKIELRKNDKGELKIRAVATGYPEDVDWGEETAQVHKQMGGGPPNFMVTFSLPKAKELLIVNPTSNSGKPFAGGGVWAELFTTFKDGRPPEFVRQFMQTPQK